MYGWIWRHLPGNTWLKALISVLLAVAVVFLLFQYVFPWAEPLLPFNDVTVDEGMGAGMGAGVVNGATGAAL
ncbi:hypothetical protein RCO28_35195 [Streptomyces sp. LHD-70]|uniref:hypothetical protein n=1 Tax=Streptomyces sp. LHD-70 TaxID=3072140 RepID=UPI00280E87E1|nr:hypothetical protein [Streptomyces sp. LHD-70]MDQ8707682.1 hypothetical protein [Streptomyces sp. LHD-70]